MTPLLSEFVWTRDTIMSVGIVLVMAGIPLASILGWYWLRLHQTRSDNALKQSMVERGMSADDIERVIAAGNDEEAGRRKSGAGRNSVVSQSAG
jgi:hypothetical protein